MFDGEEWLKKQERLMADFMETHHTGLESFTRSADEYEEKADTQLSDFMETYHTGLESFTRSADEYEEKADRQMINAYKSSILTVTRMKIFQQGKSVAEVRDELLDEASEEILYPWLRNAEYIQALTEAAYELP